MANDLFIIEEPILKYKLVFTKNDFNFILMVSNSIKTNHHNLYIKSRLIKQLLYWMYDNAIYVYK